MVVTWYQGLEFGVSDVMVVGFGVLDIEVSTLITNSKAIPVRAPHGAGPHRRPVLFQPSSWLARKLHTHVHMYICADDSVQLCISGCVCVLYAVLEAPHACVRP